MKIEQLIAALECVECGSKAIERTNGHLNCADCDAVWDAENGIFDMRPKSGSVPMPKMYSDPHYREWNNRLADIQDYFYESKGLVPWVQNAGHRAVKRFRRDRPHALTLDLACGDGGHRPYMESAENLVGLDIDQKSLEKLREKYPDYYVIRGDCTKLPFADESLDRVINIYNLEHLIHLDFALEEVRRVLKADGDMLVSVPAEGGMAWTTGRLVTTHRQFSNNGLDYLRANQIDHCNCIWQIEKAVRRHFNIAKTEYFPMKAPSYHMNLIVTWRLTK